MLYRVCSFLLLLPLICLGCDRDLVSPEEGPQGRVPFQNIEEAGGFKLTRPGTQILRTQGFMQTLWGTSWTVVDARGEKTPPPAIDFEKKMVIAVFWGDGFTGCGNGVQAIEAIYRRDDEVVVELGALHLGTCQEEVFPVQMVQINHTDLPIVFEGNTPKDGK